nr:hypothetical protein [uncultured Mogibacterium sp.]
MSKQKAKKDRIAKYLQDLNGGILFDELSDKYLKEAGVLEILRGVPVPISAGVGDELTTLTIAYGMARVIGADTNFEYKDKYIAYIKHLFGDDASKALIAEGAKYGQSGNYELATMFFRAVLLFDPKSQDALYLYGRACKDAYELNNEDESYVGNFKAESLDIFELLTMIHPEFAMGYYFLGYGYANMGLYTKADLTWKNFMELTAASGNPETEELRSEISDRMAALEEPVKIEEGVNCVLSGDYIGGLEILTRYKDGNYCDWWPLWYYMAVCAASLGDAEPAIEYYKRALVYTPSNTDIMEELASVYAAIGDQANAAKYLNKIEIVKNNIEQEDF